MTTFGEDMSLLAQELTEEFSEEIGKSTLSRVTGGIYNPDTDKVDGSSTLQTTAYMTFEEITEKEVADQSYRIKHEKCTVAGADITLVPAKDDIITKPDATSHRVKRVITDQYGAAYMLFIEKDAT